MYLFVSLFVLLHKVFVLVDFVVRAAPAAVEFGASAHPLAQWSDPRSLCALRRRESIFLWIDPPIRCVAWPAKRACCERVI